MNNHLIYKRYYLILFITLVTISYNLLYLNKDSDIEKFLNERTTLISSEYNNIYKKNRNLADLVFKTNLNKPVILKLFKEKQRGVLYNKLQKDYSELKAFNIYQLQFYLPNNSSFLRMHQPLKYDDNLTKERQTVQYVNKYKKNIHGFEIGKTSDAFRFIYPMFLNDAYIGSVEISFSTLSFLEDIKKHYDIKSSLYLNKKVIDTKILESEKINYILS
jgi:hypothetical protein